MVTAGSASGICDGAAAVLIASEEAVAKHNLTPLARIVGYGVSGCEGTIMGIGPVPSIRSMCEKTGVSLGQVDQVRRDAHILGFEDLTPVGICSANVTSEL